MKVVNIKDAIKLAKTTDVLITWRPGQDGHKFQDIPEHVAIVGTLPKTMVPTVAPMQGGDYDE